MCLCVLQFGELIVLKDFCCIGLCSRKCLTGCQKRERTLRVYLSAKVVRLNFSLTVRNQSSSELRVLLFKKFSFFCIVRQNGACYKVQPACFALKTQPANQVCSVFTKKFITQAVTGQAPPAYQVNWVLPASRRKLKRKSTGNV